MASQTFYCHNDGTIITVDATQPPPATCPNCGNGSFQSEPGSKVTAFGSASTKFPQSGRWTSNNGGGKHA